MRLTRARDIVSAFVNPSSYDAKCDCEHHAPLVPFVASMRGYVCDVCECTKPKGQVFLAAACDVCDYHVCVSCALAKWHRQAVFAEIHFGREAIPTRAPHPTRSRTRCPCKKPFDAIATPTDGFECNKCGGVQPRGSAMLACTSCDVHVCIECAGSFYGAGAVQCLRGDGGLV